MGLKLPKLKILANCEKMRIGVSLGVTHFNLKLFAALRKEFHLKIACQVTPETMDSYRARTEIYDALVSPRNSPPSRPNKAPWMGQKLFNVLKRIHELYHEKRYDCFSKGAVIEYHPHHFQFAIGQLPKVTTCHDLHIFDVPWKYKPRELSLNLFNDNLQSASAILTEFPRTFEDLPSKVEGTGDKIFLVASPTLLDNSPLHESSLQKMKEKYFSRGEPDLLIYPAQLQAHKNHKNLLSAIRVLIDSGKPVKLVCPGSDFKLGITKEIKEHRDSLGLQDFVFFPGFVSDEDLRALYEICTAVISPSLAEGGAYINQEAIVFGKPSACADIKSARMHIRQMGAVVPFFDPHDVKDIADTIRKMIKDGSKIVEKNRQAREKIASWTWKRVAERYVDVFYWVIKGCNPEEKPPQSKI